MSAPASRPIHPCVVSITDGTRGVEHSCWAHITTTRSPTSTSTSGKSATASLPNLVTASASTIAVYSADEETGRLYLERLYPNLCGSVVYLATLSAPSSSTPTPISSDGTPEAGQQQYPPDALLLGFAGDPRLSVAQVQHGLLRSDVLIDLTTALQDACHGAITPSEQDVVVTTHQHHPGRVCVSAILGGGAAVATLELIWQSSVGAWMASPPFLLPLSHLSNNLPYFQGKGPRNATTTTTATALNLGTTSFTTGFGDVISCAFISGYIEPVLVLLHSEPGGRIVTGRLGRTNGTGGAPPLFVTAISVGVHHHRAAMLWCIPVSADAQRVSAFGTTTQCLVIGVNTLIVIEAGVIQQAIAVNGWARTTCPLHWQTSSSILRPNPVMKLSLSLDGCAITWLSCNAALLSLRTGQLYVFQQSVENQWILLPLGQTLGGIGEIEQLMALPFAHNVSLALGGLLGNNKTAELTAGLVFAGSRLGNSLMLGYALESIRIPMQALEAFLPPTKEDVLMPLAPPSSVLSTEANRLDDDGDDVERILRIEEDALYAPTTTPTSSRTADLVPNSSDEDDVISQRQPADVPLAAKRQRLSAFTMVKMLVPLDTLVNLGPLGPSCVGPLSAAPKFLMDHMEGTGTTLLPGSKATTPYGAPAFVFPSGFGSSGGLALATTPGRDDRMILAEEDCLNVDAIFSLPLNRVVLLCLSSKSDVRTRILRLEQQSGEHGGEGFQLAEVGLDAWYESTLLDFFCESILHAGEFSDGSTLMLVHMSHGGYTLVVVPKLLNGHNDNPPHEVTLRSNDGNTLVQVTPLVQSFQGNTPSLSFACLWSSGEAQLCTVLADGEFTSSVIAMSQELEDPSISDMEVDDTKNGSGGDGHEDDVKRFYCQPTIVSVDLFKGPSNLFPTRPPADGSSPNTNVDKERLSKHSVLVYDEEDEELYHSSASTTVSDQDPEVTTSPIEIKRNQESNDGEVLYCALCRQSGWLEIYRVQHGKVIMCCKVAGCGQGALILEESGSVTSRLPRHHKIFVREMRFFLCGPTAAPKSSSKRKGTLCLAMEISSGDVELYIAHPMPGGTEYHKVPLQHVGRSSQEQARHRTKLIRRGIAEKEPTEQVRQFSFSRLFRVSGISGQDGLFSMCCRPFWVVADRGRPSILFHRTRHAAPAGGKERPVSGFCSDVRVPGSIGSGFIVLHERVGRVGSQRLTAFSGLTNALTSQGLLGGLSGLSFEKIPMGVTVRRIEFINDDAASSGNHPLFAMLVSREVYLDQSFYNSDGLTPEEREKLQREKELEKVQKQVEADLGGFDVESEWVEEIEREDCFKIDSDLGGAPPLRSQSYSVWIVDASNGWMVVDSFELDEYEHGITISVMHLSNFKEEPGSTQADASEESLETELFIVVGTGYVDHNGEDVSSKGRVLLFQIKRPEPGESFTPSEVAELTLAYEKPIFHGPVTTVSCLSAEGKNRLVIGAGADVNIEQWGDSRLTQVGFFRATMQILDILIFKTFFLLSDAYDSIYFLVWRESDKSLTLLAKDYDPIPVYAAGLMSRGATLTFICLDDRQNLQFFQYAPGEAAARGGNKLVCRADFHLGTQTNRFSSHFCRSSLTVHSATTVSTLAALRQQDPSIGRSDEDQKIAALFGSTDGGIGAVVPLSEPVFWRLIALQSVMANALESDCGLSSRSWRLYRRTPRRGGCRSNDRKKGVIDGDLVCQYAFLPKADQEDLASAIGSTVDLILDNILELQCASTML